MGGQQREHRERVGMHTWEEGGGGRPEGAEQVREGRERKKVT